MDKKVQWALIGGIAVVGAAVAYHLFNSQKEDDPIDDDIEKLGELRLDANGHIEFQQFLEIF